MSSNKRTLRVENHTTNQILVCVNSGIRNKKFSVAPKDSYDFFYFLGEGSKKTIPAVFQVKDLASGKTNEQKIDLPVYHKASALLITNNWFAAETLNN